MFAYIQKCRHKLFRNEVLPLPPRAQQLIKGSFAVAQFRSGFRTYHEWVDASKAGEALHRDAYLPSHGLHRRGKLHNIVDLLKVLPNPQVVQTGS